MSLVTHSSAEPTQLHLLQVQVVEEPAMHPLGMCPCALQPPRDRRLRMPKSVHPGCHCEPFGQRGQDQSDGSG